MSSPITVVKLKDGSTVVRHKAYLPNDVVGDILDNMFTGPLKQSDEYMSSLGHNDKVTTVIDNLVDYKKDLLSIRSSGSFYHDVVTARLFEVLFVWPSRNMGEKITGDWMRKRIGTRTLGSYVKTVYLHLEVVEDADAAKLIDMMSEVNNLDNFYFSTEFISPVALEKLILVIRDHSALSLRKFECYVPQALSLIPLAHSHSMKNLRICASSMRFCSFIPLPPLRFPMPANSPFRTGSFNFDHLHTLRLANPFILAREIGYKTPNLKSLALDYTHEYKVGRYLLDFLVHNGKELRVLDVRHLGKERPKVYLLCPKLEHLMFDITPNTPIKASAGSFLHKNITHIGLRGCKIDPFENEVTSYQIFKLLDEFRAPGYYPKLKVVKLMDLDPLCFSECAWNRKAAWNWLSYMGLCAVANIELLDKNGNKCSSNDLINLIEYAANEKAVYDIVDGQLIPQASQTDMPYVFL